MSGHKIAEKGVKFSRFDNNEKGKNIYNVFAIHYRTPEYKKYMKNLNLKTVFD